MKRHWLRPFFLFIAVAFAASRVQASAADRVQANGEDTEVMRQLVITYFNAVAAKDFVKMAAQCTDGVVIYEDGKIWNHDSVYFNIQRHQPFAVKFTLSDFRLFADARSGDGSYHSHADFVFHDTVKLALDFIETATFRKTAAGWKINSIHITALDQPDVGFPKFYRKYDSVRYIAEHYRKRMQVFSGEPQSRSGTIFLGNSITEYGDWRRLWNEPNVLNRGIAGDNTFGMLDRLPEVIARQPAMLVIEAGINDIGQGVPPAMIAGNIHSIVEWVKVKSPGTRIYVISVLPTNEHAAKDYPEVAGKNAVVREVNRQLLDQAAVDGYTYVDLAGRVTDKDGQLAEEFARPDGLHLNEKGYELLKEIILR
jgi:lysophospholipase L1-like esterase